MRFLRPELQNRLDETRSPRYGDSQGGAADLCQDGLCADAEAAIGVAAGHPRLPTDCPIIVHGHRRGSRVPRVRAGMFSQILLFSSLSLGGAVAVQVAFSSSRERPRIAGLVLENTFTSTAEMAAKVSTSWLGWLRRVSSRRWITQMFPPIGWLPRRLVSKFVCDPWSSERAILARARQGGAGEQGLPVLFLASNADPMVPPAQMRRLRVAAARSGAVCTWRQFASTEVRAKASARKTCV